MRIPYEHCRPHLRATLHHQPFSLVRDFGTFFFFFREGSLAHSPAGSDCQTASKQVSFTLWALCSSIPSYAKPPILQVCASGRWQQDEAKHSLRLPDSNFSRTWSLAVTYAQGKLEAHQHMLKVPWPYIQRLDC